MNESDQRMNENGDTTGLRRDVTSLVLAGLNLQTKAIFEIS